MDPTIAGLVGAGIGAIASLGGATLTQSLQRKHERTTWLRNKQIEAYSQVLRYALRLLHKRSTLTAGGQAVIGREVLKEWFDELAELHAWFAVVTMCCTDASRAQLAPIHRRVSAIHDRSLASGELSDEAYDSLVAAYDALVSCARRDLRVTM